MSYGPQTRNPWEHDESEPEPEDHPTEGLCYFCRQVDDATKLIKVSGHWLAHASCASEDAVYAAGLERESRRDIERDDFNQTRR